MSKNQTSVLDPGTKFSLEFLLLALPAGNIPSDSPETEDPATERPSASRLIQRALLRGTALLASLGLGRELPPAPHDPPPSVPPREDPPVVQVEPCKEEPPTDLLVDLASSGEGDRETLPPLWVQTSPKVPRLGESRVSRAQKWGKCWLLFTPLWGGVD